MTVGWGGHSGGITPRLSCRCLRTGFLTNGLALSCPAMSGAEPWHGSNTPGPSGFPMEAEGSMPREPTYPIQPVRFHAARGNSSV